MLRVRRKTSLFLSTSSFIRCLSSLDLHLDEFGLDLPAVGLQHLDHITAGAAED
jgi:hypothetical protein